MKPAPRQGVRRSNRMGKITKGAPRKNSDILSKGKKKKKTIAKPVVFDEKAREYIDISPCLFDTFW